MKKYIERYWRKATKEDSVKEPMMDARFRDANGGWEHGKFYRWDRVYDQWTSEDGCNWDEAEVYDAPDPGEGYELVDPTIEKPGPGIEFLFGIHWHRAGETAPLDVNATYRRKIQPETKPEAAEPVTFVAHPIQVNDEGAYCFKGKPIQFRSYAVLNEQGHYLQHLPAYPPQYAPEFRQAFTPLQLLQLSVRELGSNIRLIAVEPVDVDKLKQEYMQELKEKLRPKVPASESIREKVMCKGHECYVLTRFRCLTVHGPHPKVRVVLQPTDDVNGSLFIVFADDLQEIPSEPQPEAPQPVKEPKYVPFTWDDQDDFGGEWIEDKANKKIELIAKFSEINGHLLINDKLASDILEDWRFVKNGMPVGKRVED